MLAAFASCRTPPAESIDANASSATVDVLVSATDEPLLAPGPYAVGFRAYWTFDLSRTYRTAFDDGATYGASEAPRPILVNLWYPAAANAGAPMARREYLPCRGSTALKQLVPALDRYERDVIATEVFGAKESELDATAHEAFDAYLARPTIASRDVDAAAGRFPLVLAHAGAGSSYEDNAEFYEHLASHGYVVASSPFLLGDGTTFNVDGRDASARDLEFLVRHVGAFAYVEHGVIGAIGHSAGAQALLRFATVPQSPVDACVLLDTTQDYNSLLDPRWSFVEPVRAARDEVRESLMFVANGSALFALGDELTASERAYLTLPGLSHNDYIAQGISCARETARRTNTPEAVAHAKDALRQYRALCAAIVSYFDATLKGSATANAALADLERNPLAGQEPHLERMPRGASVPAPYDAASNVAPTPRQLRGILTDRGAAATIELLERYRLAEPKNPIYAEAWFAYALCFELANRDAEDDARALYGFFKTLHPDLIDAYAAQVEFFASIGKREYAFMAAKTGLALEPSRADFARWRDDLADAAPGD